ncbi:phage tail assembly protein [Bosea sp. (in: a-proteobacteria)]|uniref:phage tail assembly protein n=1 Tax=Bosea sp. (in: a-proteobacteria) TaxID=1871050 RepID=UPI001ACBE8C7|nr:phage tail assembly protein [Bosea sp. (in: a-proteobacteria)]MBN9439363.1 phage tail assembly protein [Bosea sp. (in: a-proteobacteria)]
MTRKAAPQVTLLGDRTREVPLIYPAQFDGVTYEKVTVRRMTQAELTAYIASSEDDAVPPMFDIPPEVLAALDPDDSDAVFAAAMELLPRRMKRALPAAAPKEADPIDAAIASLKSLGDAASALATDPAPTP